MRVVVIETSGKTCGFAVSVGGHIRSEHTLDERAELSQRIIGLIDETVREAGCDIHQVHGVAVSLGPGSWTGLRIGVTTAKALAQGLGVPLWGVPTFEAVARALSHVPEPRLIVVVPCRKGEVYAARFAVENGQVCRIEAEQVVGAEDLTAQLRDEQMPLALCGDSADEVKATLGKQVRLIEDFTHQVLTGMALITHERWQHGQADDLFAVKPIYLAPSQAERVMGIRVS